MDELDQEMARLRFAKETNREDIEKVIKRVHEQAEERKQQLMEINEFAFHDAQDYVLNIRKAQQGPIDMINKNLDLSEKVVRNGTLHEIIHTNQILMSTAGGVQPGFPELEFRQPCISFDLDKGKKAVERNLHNLGEINFEDVLPEKCEFRCKEAIAGQKAEMQAQLFSYSKLVVYATSHFSVEITDSEDTHLTSVISSTDHGYKVTFTPQISGPHTVSGVFQGHHLLCEPNMIHVSMGSTNPVLKFGRKGKGKGTFDRPWGLAIDNNDCLYVADFGNGLIQKFNDDGEFLSQFNVSTSSEDFATVDMTLDGDQLFCIGLSRNSTFLDDGQNILVFDLDRGLILKRCYTQKLSGAVFIAVDMQGNLIISDTEKKCLTKVNKDFELLCHIGNFKYPGCISIAVDDSIIVPDRLDDCVYIFNPDGTIKHQFGSSGTGKGQLKQPCGVANDGTYILVAEEGNNRIQVFKFDGTFVSMIESCDDPLLVPSGLAVTDDGHVYVADRDNHCVKKYKYKDLFR